MSAALIVGIDYYKNISGLHGCVSDASAVKSVLERNGDGTVNFEPELLTAATEEDSIKKTGLKDKIAKLFEIDTDIVLFYFAGHGHVENVGGYLVTSDSERGDDGISLSEVLTMANDSPAANKIIILDSCHSGIAGASTSNNDFSVLSEGVTILTASTKDQYASEEAGSGVFTGLLVDALQGGAANLTGDITPGSVYAHIDQSLGEWKQRPVFKTNVKQFVSLRKITPPISLEDLKKINQFFPSSGYEYQLDPTYEQEMKGRDDGMPSPDLENTEIFAVLQKYNRLNLLVPVGVPNMWNAAMESKSCRLTALGEHYRKLVSKERI
jgi:hypothetical protein